jgi:hypothetical protein
MASVFVSPGVYTQEIDESFIPSAAEAGVGAALIGLSSKGPAYRPITVTGFGQFKEVFGGLNPEHYAGYAARNYLRNGDSLTFVKLAGRTSAGVGQAAMLAFPETGSTTASLVNGNGVLGVVRRRSNDASDILMYGTATNFSLSANGEVATGLSLSPSSPKYVKKVIGTNPKVHTDGELFSDLYVDAVFDYSVGDYAGTVDNLTTQTHGIDNWVSVTAQMGNTVGTTAFDTIAGLFEPQTPAVVSQNFDGQVFEMFKFHQMTHSPASVKVSVTNVNKAASATEYPTFSVAIRASGDTDDQPQVLEAYENVTMDPTSPKFIGRMIGDRYPVYNFNTSPVEVMYEGNFDNRSKFVRVEVVDGAPTNAHPSGFKGYPTANVNPTNRDALGLEITFNVSAANEITFAETGSTITSSVSHTEWGYLDAGATITVGGTSHQQPAVATVSGTVVTFDTNFTPVPGSDVLVDGESLGVTVVSSVANGADTDVTFSGTVSIADATVVSFPGNDGDYTIVSATSTVLTVSESILDLAASGSITVTVDGTNFDTDFATGWVTFAPISTKTNHLNTRGEVSSSTYAGVSLDAGMADRLKNSVINTSNGTFAQQTGIIYGTTSDEITNVPSSYTLIDTTGANADNFSATNQIRFTMAMYGGSDGFDPRKNMLNSYNDGSLSEDFSTAINILSNPEEIDFNLIAVPGVHSGETGTTNDKLIDMITARSDAFALIDLGDTSASGAGLALSVAAAVEESSKYDTNYAATYYPWVRINDSENNRLMWVPPSVEVMGAYSFNDSVSQPWYAPAGFTRGGLDSVLEARRRLNQSARDDLYQVNVNPIATFPGQGIVIFGQKTLQKKQSVLDRVNVRRMLLEVRKTIAGFSRLFVFEANNAGTRGALLARVNEYLNSVQAANGLTQFRAILDETTTTPDLIDRNIIKGKIFLQPTQAAEIIIFDFNLDGTGATFGEV